MIITYLIPGPYCKKQGHKLKISFYQSHIELLGVSQVLLPVILCVCWDTGVGNIGLL